MSAAQLAPQSDTKTFAFFYAANLATVHLLDMIRSELSPPNLECRDEKIGYKLSIPLSANEHGSKCVWRIGSGPPTSIIKKKLEHVKPDIMLCPANESISAKLVRKEIKDIHAILHCHAKSGVLMLSTTSNRRHVIYEGGDINGQDLVLTLGKTKSCVMRQDKNYIQIGQYRFCLEFVPQSQGTDKIKVQQTSYPGLHPSPILNFTPIAYPKTSWNIWLHNTAHGTSITSGVNIFTGEPVAVKQLKNEMALQKYTSYRLNVNRRFHENPEKGILGIIDAWHKHDISTPCKEVDGKTSELICYSMPLAKNNFHNMPWYTIVFEERLALLYQTLVGLVELHQLEITHENILPESLLILAEPEPIAEGQFRSGRAVLSLDMQKKTPRASICIAPEKWKQEGPRKPKDTKPKEGFKLEKTKHKESQKLDKAKLDIWALAASWLFAFLCPPEGLKINEWSYKTLQGSLDAQTKKGNINEPLAKLLHKMLAFEPQERPSAADALADEAWKPIKEKNSRKRKRAEMTNGNSDGKRVRLLSPETDMNGYNAILERN